jgi:hypothetical protein
VSLIRPFMVLLTAVLVVIAAVTLVRGRGVPGHDEAIVESRAVLSGLGFTPRTEGSAVLESDQLVTWALERSSRERGRDLAWGEGGAVRWRTTFADGGEAVVTPLGTLWSAHRPVPTAPGRDLFPAVAQLRLEAALSQLVSDPASWHAIRRQSWREGGHTWHRARFEGGAGPLPQGWRREIDVEMVGTTVFGFRRRLQPLGTPMGIVTGRVRELDVLRVPAFVGLVILLVAVLVSGAGGWAYSFRLSPFAAGAVGALVAGFSFLVGVPPYVLALLALSAAAAVWVAPLWASPCVAHPRWGPAAGVAVAIIALQAPAVVTSLGGWIPSTAAVATHSSPFHLVGAAALPALVEEPLLRGALPGLLAPLVGWWGAALAGAGLGSLLHGVPTVPLVVTILVGFVLQMSMVLVARAAGVTAAVLARGVCEVLLRRPSYPVGESWDTAALVVVGLALLYLVWPRRAT